LRSGQNYENLSVKIISRYAHTPLSKTSNETRSHRRKTRSSVVVVVVVARPRAPPTLSKLAFLFAIALSTRHCIATIPAQYPVPRNPTVPRSAHASVACANPLAASSNVSYDPGTHRAMMDAIVVEAVSRVSRTRVVVNVVRTIARSLDRNDRGRVPRRVVRLRVDFRGLT